MKKKKIIKIFSDKNIGTINIKNNNLLGDKLFLDKIRDGRWYQNLIKNGEIFNLSNDKIFYSKN